MSPGERMQAQVGACSHGLASLDTRQGLGEGATAQTVPLLPSGRGLR